MGSNPPLFLVAAAPVTDGYDFSPSLYPPTVLPTAGTTMLIYAINTSVGPTRQMWTFDSTGASVALFSTGAPPYTVNASGTQLTIDSKITQGIYYLSSTSSFTLAREGEGGFGGTTKGMNGSLNVGSHPTGDEPGGPTETESEGY